MIIGVPAEALRGERRVALVPAAVAPLKKSGNEVLVQSGAGERAGFADDLYVAQGARIVPDRAALLAAVDLVAFLANPAAADQGADGLRESQLVVGLLDPFGTPAAVAALAGRGVTACALELLPRVSRAQQLDALTSMATIAGYKAVLLAADRLPRMFPLMMTAAGTIAPAKVLVIGAGVAGLQAIATARRLGAVVDAYDVRPAVREQVESLGARFVELDLETAGAEDAGGYARELGEEFYRRQREALGNVVAARDVVITTAAIPGSRAPLLVTEDAVRRMEPGSVIVDLAAPTGGNCELTVPGETVERHGVSIVGPLELAGSVPHDASQMYSRNMVAFLRSLLGGSGERANLDDELVRDTVVARGGEVVQPRVRQLLGLAPLEPHPGGGTA